MRKSWLVLITLSALGAASAASAERWRYFPVGGGAVAFDEHSLRADVLTGMTSVNTVVHYATPQLSPNGSVSFRAERFNFQCLRQMFLVTNSGIYDLRGQLLARYPDSDWITLDQSLGAAALFQRVACTTDQPPVTGESDTLAALYEVLPRIAAGSAPSAPAPAPINEDAAAGVGRQPPQLRD